MSALRSAQDSAPTSSAVVDSGSSIEYELEQQQQQTRASTHHDERTTLEGSFDTPASRARSQRASDPASAPPDASSQPHSTMAIAFQPSGEEVSGPNYSARFRSDPSTWADEDGSRRTAGRERKVAYGSEGFALPVRRATTTDTMRATIDERRSSFDEPPERVPEGEELSQPLLDDKSLQGPEGQNVPAQTASLAPGVETADRHLPVLNIPHADGSTEVAATASDSSTREPSQHELHQPQRRSVPTGYLVGFPRSQEEEGSEPSADENEYLFAVPRANRERRSSFWDNPLPSGVSDVNFDIGPKSAPEAGDSDSELQFNVTVTRRTPVVAWVMLIGALLSVSITGWAIKEQKGPSALMKCTWRSQATSLFVLPLCLYFVWKDDLLYRPFLSYQMKQAVYASLGYLLFNGTFLWALDHTSSAHGFLLNNLHSVLIVFYRAMIGNPVQLMEALGAVVGLTGATLVCLDSQLSSENARSSASWTGDIVAAIGSTFGALYFVAAKETRPKMNISIFALICHLSNLPFFVAFTYLDAWLFPHISPWPSIDRDPTTGVFGWLTTKQITSELAISLVSTLMGTTGYVLVMRYVEPLAISTTTLLEPVVAAAIGVVFVGESFPGGLTMFGAVTLIAGTVMVLRCERGSETRTDISDQAKKVVANRETPE